jgi:alpha-L-rhamnosidase
MKKILFTACILYCFIFNVNAQFTPDTDFRAKWITFNNDGTSENAWYGFRKTVDISTEIPKSLIARIAVDSKYWLWINDKLVVFEGQLKRGPSPNDTYYDEVDIAPFLTKGKNYIALAVWFWGREGFCHKSSGKMGLLFDASSKDLNILSDNTWEVFLNQAFGNTSDPIPNYRLPEYNIKYYAKNAIKWKKDEKVQGMKNALFAGNVGTLPWGHLWKRPFPQWKNSGTVEYENKITYPFISDGTPIRMKLPKNYSITPYLKIEAEEEKLIDIRTDNYNGGSEYNLRTEYVTKNGVQDFETYGYINGHEVIYSIPKGIKVIDLKYRRTSYPTEHIGKFISDDASLNSLWEKSLNTMDINMRDAIQDPDRERAQWWGDAVIILGEIFYSCDSNGTSAVKKSISNLVEWQKTDGALFSPIPAGKWDLELPTQMLAAIGKYGFWRYHKYTGDTAMIKYVYPKVKRYLNLWQIGEDGLVVHRNGGWNWFDWGKNIDEKVMENAWYYMAIESAKDMAKILAIDADMKEYEKQMQIIKKNFNEKLWNGTAYRNPEYKGEDKFVNIKNVLLKEFHAGPYIEKYILESLFMMGYEKEAIERMKNRYAAMIVSPVTTLWEGWDIGSAEYGGGSYNHGWSGGPLTLMHEYIAGIAPTKSNYESFSILPQMGNINTIKCLTPSKKGNIVVDISSNAQSFRMLVDSPTNTIATVGLPKNKILSNMKSVFVNGKSYLNNKKVGKNMNGITYSGENENYILFTVQAGKWDFLINW